MRRGENIYKRKDGRWEGRYKKGYKANGQLVYGYVYEKSYHEVRKKLYPLKVYHQSHQEKYGKGCISLREWGCAWLQEIQGEIKPSTFSSYCYKLENYVFSFIGEYYLNELTLDMGKKLLNSWVEKGLSFSTMQVVLRLLCQCLTIAKERDYIKDHPFHQVRLPKKRKQSIRALSKKEQQTIEKVALNEKNDTGLPTYLALHTGLRIGEISALRWEDIDFEQGMIRVSHTYQRVPMALDGKKTQLLLGSTKTEAGARLVPMSRSLKKLLVKHKQMSSHSFVFSTNGKPMEPRLLTHHFHRIRKKCGLENVHFHQLRHTFATRCLEAQNDILSVSALLGHTSTQLTLDTYADSMMEQRIAVIIQMERAIV
ncbi:tyrosine-type recombinase/integrase [Enterococcus sp. DIV0187]|uniref:tyrosine-type recombinase/integrase n=1 Tax=Enterococcus sp. DIV0187 TaxID=2774644 RepID=UPI003F20E9CF